VANYHYISYVNNTRLYLDKLKDDEALQAYYKIFNDRRHPSSSRSTKRFLHQAQELHIIHDYPLHKACVHLYDLYRSINAQLSDIRSYSTDFGMTDNARACIHELGDIKADIQKYMRIIKTSNEYKQEQEMLSRVHFLQEKYRQQQKQIKHLKQKIKKVA
jgi:hypothetical protein